MLAILHPDDYDAWMQGEEIPLVSFEAERMTARPVSTFVNSVKNQGRSASRRGTTRCTQLKRSTS